MTDGSEQGAGFDEQTRKRLEQELADLRKRRQDAVTEIREQESDVGDRADEADALEQGEDLGAIDDRIRVVTGLLTGDQPAKDGTVATLRFDDGSVHTVRLVAITEEAAPGQEDVTVTLDSPLGLAIAGHRAGDMISYKTPDGEVHASILHLESPGA